MWPVAPGPAPTVAQDAAGDGTPDGWPRGWGQIGPWVNDSAWKRQGGPRLGVQTAPAGESHVTLPPRDTWKQARVPQGSPCPAGGLPEILAPGTTAQAALASS